MEIEGGLTLTPEQASSWQAAYPEEYRAYVDEGLYYPDTRVLLDIPSWMNDGIANNGPFDINLNQSHDTAGW